MQIESFYHQDTQSFCHILYDEMTLQAAIIDPVMDYKANSGQTSFIFADDVIARVNSLGLKVLFILETHVHADHLSAAQHIKQQLGGRILIGDKVSQVQAHFDQVFAINSQQEALFDGLLSAGDVLELGEVTIQALATPGHTPACLSYVVRAPNESVHVFVGDTLFMPDIGTARCDFPGGDAIQLYRSIQSIFALGDDAQLHMCHDYPPNGRDVRSVVSVAEQKRDNIHVSQGVSESEFVAKREARDENLAAPRLILPSLQVNVRAGHLPSTDEQGRRFLKIPIR
ncbi:MAG: MBL fold metallo-hydrolase [Bermanella sp.]|nr:MBL fold metallo-hydrolase [Bermanella sp.]|tara:strand:+ start:4205 stop:5059 length:855 start_codon:yes stop_codon:yes gene_type:complete